MLMLGSSTTSRAIRGNSPSNIGIEGVGGPAGVYGWSQKGAGVVGMTRNARDYAGYFWESVYVNGSLIVGALAGGAMYLFARNESNALALASSIFVTTATDIVSMGMLLALATYFLL